ncbi:MAG: type II toxin-antitoxin system RelE/ParE family toxin [Candidatus Pacearchaeota archaeon]|nr:type II toxin-antitoxin system RelE/ParE family toxin [Candidatus Pacearchaeota archaeon]
MYTIILEKEAEKFLFKIEKTTAERITKRIHELKNNPELGKPLVGKLSGLWSLRIGDYRAIYQIRKEQIIILVLKIGHRKNIYEN